jgi:hypothetical protein
MCIEAAMHHVRDGAPDVTVAACSSSNLVACRWRVRPALFVKRKAMCYLISSYVVRQCFRLSGPGYRSLYSSCLWAGRFGVRIPLGTRFSTSVQTGLRAHTASYTNGAMSFPEAKRPGRDVNHPPLSNTEVKERVKLYIYSPFGPSWSVLGWNLPFTCIFVG